MAATQPHPTAIIGTQYCAPYLVDLIVVRKAMSISHGNFVVTNTDGNVVFKVKGSVLTFRSRRLLIDVAGKPIVTLRRKILTVYDTWQAFRGESTEARDLIFTLKGSSLIRFKTKLDVFLANNTKDVCDFKVEGSWLKRSYNVYAAKRTVQSILIGKDTFTVTAYPNVDYAFMGALIVILHKINKRKRKWRILVFCCCCYCCL